jgi:hypothetical protein
MLVTIDVTDGDIDGGTDGNFYASVNDCMVARSLKRVVMPEVCINVGIGDFYLELENFYLPEVAAEKIRQWTNWVDKPHKFERPTAFSFEIDIPAEFLKMEIPQEVVLA